ncbi:MAG: DUF3307 domain-containing protein, partial [Pseudomonadota bacterium]
MTQRTAAHALTRSYATMLDPASLLLVLAGFSLKHALFDFALQTPWMIQNKGRYGHSAGLCHAGLHALGSILVLAVAGVSLTMMLVLAALECITHYHLDWMKEQVNARAGWEPTMRAYWVWFGTDQALHHLTYLAMCA